MFTPLCLSLRGSGADCAMPGCLLPAPSWIQCGLRGRSEPRKKSGRTIRWESIKINIDVSLVNDSIKLWFAGWIMKSFCILYWPFIDFYMVNERGSIHKMINNVRGLFFVLTVVRQVWAKAFFESFDESNLSPCEQEFPFQSINLHHSFVEALVLQIDKQLGAIYRDVNKPFLECSHWAAAIQDPTIV